MSDSLDSRVSRDATAKQLMLNADRLYYTPAMRAALLRLSDEWQTATQLCAKWFELQTLVIRGRVERRDNPDSVEGKDFYQWRLKPKEAE